MTQWEPNCYAELTLEGCIDICREAEISSAQLKVLKSVSISAWALHQGFSQSNGLVERTVQTAKKLLKKTYEDSKDPFSGV